MQATHDTETSRQLREWFMARLEEGHVRFDREDLSYDANSEYDFAFHRLLAQAREAWIGRYGQAPTPGQLTQAFFDAEFERFRKARLARLPLLTRLCQRFR